LSFFTQYFIDIINQLCKDSVDISIEINKNTVLEHSKHFNIDNFSSSIELNELNLNNCDLPLHNINNTQCKILDNLNSDFDVLCSVISPSRLTENVNLGERLSPRGQRVQLASLNEVCKNHSRGQLSSHNEPCIYCSNFIDVCVCSDCIYFDNINNDFSINTCTFQEFNQCNFGNLTENIFFRPRWVIVMQQRMVMYIMILTVLII
jgi:hypothetical protein